ncbi:gluconate 2-dehydrogenase subunit 3 family protein [Myxococcota bacterium]|nr:gluconate 2-dehydrogenase subunit 3 family protein [Myxococcota bacterium]
MTGLFVAALIAWLFTRALLGYPKPTTHYRRLLRGEAAFVEAACGVMFPAGGAIPLAGTEVGAAPYLDRMMDASKPRIRALMHSLFFLVEHASLVFRGPGRGGRRRFTRLDPEQQLGVLRGWETSSFFARRLVFVSLRSLLAMAYLQHPSVLRELGIAPMAIDTSVCEADLWMPRVGADPSTIPWSVSDVNTPRDDVEPLNLDSPLHPDYAEDSS